MKQANLQPQPPIASARNADQAGFLLLITILILITVGVLLGITLPSIKPDHNMERQPYYRTYEPTSAFVDGMSERPLVAGTVPRPKAQSPGLPYVAVRSPGPALYPELASSQDIPFEITPQILHEGQEQYTIYCAMCHGATGDGRGMIPHRGFYPPPSYHIPRLNDASDAYLFNVITNGYGTMFSHSDRVKPDDRWKIVAYIRALQLAVKNAGPLDRDMQKPAGVWP